MNTPKGGLCTPLVLQTLFSSQKSEHQALGTLLSTLPVRCHLVIPTLWCWYFSTYLEVIKLRSSRLSNFPQAPQSEMKGKGLDPQLGAENKASYSLHFLCWIQMTLQKTTGNIPHALFYS